MRNYLKTLVVGFLSLLLLACEAPQLTGKSTTGEVHYLGRYDMTEAGDVRMGWPGSGLSLRFRGTKLTVTITDGGNGIMDAVINGKSSALILREGRQDYDIVSSDTESLFDISLTRRTEVFDTGLFEINDVKVTGELVGAPAIDRKILFIGDSITTGFGVRGNTKDCQYSPASNAPRKSYAWLAADALKAEPHLVAISGRGVVFNYDNDPNPVMPLQIDYAVPDTDSRWEHTKFQADVVVVMLGTNDWSTVDPGQEKFNSGYLALVNDIRARFPKAHIVMASGPLLGGAQGAAIVDGIDYVKSQMSSDANLSSVNLSLSETQLKWSCNAHPGRDSMVKMANDVSAHISKQTGWKAKTRSLPKDLTIAPPPEMYEGGKAHYAKRVKEIAKNPPLEGGVLFLGDSITEAGQWGEYYPNIPTANHGIGWDTVRGVGGRLQQVILNRPDKVFIKIGTNDISYGHDPVDMAEDLENIIRGLKFKMGDAKIYIQSVMPRELENRGKVDAINAEYKKVAQDLGVTFIDLREAFAAPDGSLKAELTYDNLHLNDAGYKVWAEALRPFVEGE